MNFKEFSTNNGQLKGSYSNHIERETFKILYNQLGLLFSFIPTRIFVFQFFFYITSFQVSDLNK